MAYLPVVNAPARQQALLSLSAFNGWILAGNAMTQFNKQTIHKQLLDRIQAPYKINQDQASLCGPAAVMYTLARHRPDIYVQLGIELFISGQANVNDLLVTPRMGTLAMRTGPHPDLDIEKPEPIRIAAEKNIHNDGYLNNMASADWLILASLRDSRNQTSTLLQLNYDQVSDEVAGISFPSALETWYKQLGFKHVVNRTNLVFSKSFSALYAMQEKLAQGYTVNVFVDSAIFSSMTGNSFSFAPNHWVTLSSEIQVHGKVITDAVAQQLDSEYVDYINYDDSEDDGFSSSKPSFTHPIFFTVYTWGKLDWGLGGKVNQLPIDIKDFKKHFYGFVAAKY